MDDTHVQRFVWSSSLTEILVSSLLDLYHDSYWHMEKGFKNGYYNELAKRVRIVAPNSGVLGKPHVESALKMLRTYTLAYNELLTKGSGFSFNYSTHMIEIDEISWKEWKKTHTLVRNVMIRPFPHYDDLCQVYCGSKATGVEETTGYAEREAILGEGIEGVTGVEETHELDDTQQVPSYVAPTPPNPHFVRERFSSQTGPGQVLREKIEFKHRLSIALGAAKGLAHLHSLSPRLIHKDFKTANVLVDENFIAKVADAGVRNFLGRVDIAGSSSQVPADEIFLAPEVREFRRFSEKSDVYSFGVFLLELVSGREATELQSPDLNQNLVEWVQNHQDYTEISSIIDQRLGNRFTAEGMEEFIQLIIRCVNPSSERRPAMSYVVMELDRIYEKEMNLTTVMGEGTPTVTLGSQLFRSSR